MSYIYLQYRINKKRWLDRDCLRKIVAHQALYVRLKQPAADIDGNFKAGRHEKGGVSENIDTMREVTKKLASLTLVDNTES
jgi:hypothetical protein